MAISSEGAGILFGLASAVSWGGGDFCGGVATRRANVYSTIILSQAISLILLVILALIFERRLPSPNELGWSAGAGLVGVIGLASLYQALALGKMGIAAPVSSVLATGLPVVLGYALGREAAPTAIKVAGFALAIGGIALLSLTEKTRADQTGLLLAMLAGLGFAGFYVLFDLRNSDLGGNQPILFGPLAFMRVTSVSLILALAFVLKQPRLPGRNLVPLVTLASVLDTGGNAFWAAAAQAGRYDMSVVLSSTYPMFTSLLAFFVLKERMTRLQTAGVLMVLLAVAMIALPEQGAAALVGGLGWS